MNKQAFLQELTRRLEERNVPDVAEIVAEYAAHFSHKAADGYAEEEIAEKLGDPRELAAEYAQGEASVKKRGRWGVVLGLCLAGLCLVILYIAAFAWVLSFAIGGFATALAGLCLIAAPLFPVGVLSFAPMPYLGSALIGATVLALGVLLLLFTASSFQFCKKSITAFTRWLRGVATGRKFAPYAVFPLHSGRTRRAMRAVAIIALVAFVLSAVAAYVGLALRAGALEFWHAWNWFGYTG